jgi:hypothetical protein
MKYFKDLIFKFKCKWLLKNQNTVEQKLEFIFHCKQILHAVDFHKPTRSKLTVYTDDYEDYITLVYQCNKDLRIGQVLKPIPVITAHTLEFSRFFTDRTVDLVPFDRDHCNEVFITEITKYVTSMEKLKDNKAELAFFTRRHTQVIEDTVELLKANL